MSNTISVNFIPCNPAPANGYKITWRVVGSGDPYTEAGFFTETPAIFSDPAGTEGQCYEGFIQSDCSDSGESGSVVGQAVAWSTPCEESGDSGSSLAFLVRAADGAGAICDQPAMIVYTAPGGSISLGNFIYFDAALTMPVDSYFYVVEGNPGMAGIIYEVSTGGEIVANSGLSCS